MKKNLLGTLLALTLTCLAAMRLAAGFPLWLDPPARTNPHDPKAATATPWIAAAPSDTCSPTVTPTPTSPAGSSTSTPTLTPSPSGTLSMSGTPTGTSSLTLSPTPSGSITSTSTRTGTPSVTRTPTASLTSSISATFSQSPTASPTATATLTPYLFMVDDFEDGDMNALLPAFGGPWSTQQDGTGTINAAIASPGTGSSSHAMEFSGSRGAWCQGVCLLHPSGVAFDASGFAGVRFWFKGDGATYRLNAPTTDMNAAADYDFYSRAFTAPAGVWTLIQIPFSTMAQQGWGAPMPFSTNLITTLQWATTAGTTFDFQIDDAAFYNFTGPVPTQTQTLSATPTPTSAGTPTETPTITTTPTTTSTSTQSPTPTQTATASPTATATLTPYLFMVDDFEDGDMNALLPAFGGPWSTQQDGTGTINAAIASPGAGSSSHAMEFSGSRGAWCQGVCLLYPSGVAFDASGFAGVRFWFKGDGATYRLNAPTTDMNAAADYDFYSRAFTAPAGVWTLIQIPFSTMAQQGWGAPMPFSTNLITTLQWATTAGTTFDFQIDDVAFYNFTGPVPTQTQTASFTQTSTPADSPTQTTSPTDSPTAGPSATPTLTLSMTSTQLPTATPTDLPPVPTVTWTETSMTTPTTTGTSSPTGTVTATATPTP